MKPEQSAPFCSILAVLAMPLLGIISIPFWRWHVSYQIKSAPSEIYSPDPGQFGGFAVVAGVVATGLLGALFGLGLVCLATYRKERWPWLRGSALAINAVGVLAGVILLINKLVHP